MKLKLKMTALAAVLAVAGSAHADLVGANTGNSSLALVAFNTVTNSYYVRDLGVSLNSFLPNSVTTLPGDGIGGVSVTGTVTPEAGYNQTWATDATWATWFSQQSTPSQIAWTVVGGDSLTANSSQGVSRLLLASSTPLTVSNGTVRNAVASGTGISVLATQLNPMGYSTTGSLVPVSYLQNLILQANTLSTLDIASNLYYFTATTQTGSSSTIANQFAFSNSQNTASILLTSAGDFTYALAPATVSAVPLPGAAWLMGAGLMAIGGMVRRRKAAAEA